MCIALRVTLLQAQLRLNETGAQQRKVQQRLATLKRQQAAVTAKGSAAGQISPYAGLRSPLLCCCPSALPYILLFICGMVSSPWSCCTQCIALCTPIICARDSKGMQAVETSATW